MPRSTVGPFLKGMDSVTDPNTMGGNFSPDCRDVRFNRGICETRAGYNILDAEPSYLDGTTDKLVWGLSFDAASSEYGSSSFVQTVGPNFTVIWDMLPSNTADGSYVMWRAYDGANTVAQCTYIVASGLVKFRISLRNAAGTTYQGDTTAATAASYGALRNFGILSCNANGNVILYIGGVSQTLSVTGTYSAPMAASATLYISQSGAGANYATQVVKQFVIVNRDLLSEYGSQSIVNAADTDKLQPTYFPLGYPVDAINNDPDILCHYLFWENTGTSVTDYSRNAATMTLFNTPTWVTSPGGQHLYGRGLGIGTFIHKNGNRYNAIGFTRNGTTSTNTAPDGVVYMDRVDKVWSLGVSATNQPIYYLGASSVADDSFASLTGLDPFARHCYLQAGNMFHVHNGKDFPRKYINTWSYLGGTAPPTAPLVDVSGGAALTGTFVYCYTYYSSTTFTETGRSPTTAPGAIAGKSPTVTWAVPSDTQFDKVRIYRTLTTGAIFYMLTEQAIGTGGPYTDAITDTVLAQAPILPGADASGNAAVKRLYRVFPEYEYGGHIVNGVKRPSLRAPPTGASGARGAGGSGSLSAGDYYFAYSWYDPATGAETGMSPMVRVAGVLATESINVTAMSSGAPSASYTQIRIYRTKAWTSQYTPGANGSAWYLDQTITAGATATLTQADASLTTTIETNGLPPKCQYAVLFANRVWTGGDPDNPGMLYWSEYGDYDAFPYQNALAPRGVGIAISALWATEQYIFVSFEDGRMFAMPHPGDDPDLITFVPLNLVEFARQGGCVAHFTAKTTNIGTMWLGRDGIYLLQGTTLQRWSNRMTPMFRFMNGDRSRYATALWKRDESLYMVCFPRGFTGKARLNDTWINYYTDGDAWSVDTLPPTDVAGVIEDAQRNERYCFIQPTGILCELLTLNRVQEYLVGNWIPLRDGNCYPPDATTAASPTICSFNDPGITASPGFNGGYSVWFVRTDAHTSTLDGYVQRVIYRVGGSFLTGCNFAPTFLAGIDGRTMKAYIGGIKSEWRTPMLDFGYSDDFKVLTSTFVGNKGQQEASDCSIGAVVQSKYQYVPSTFYKLPDACTPTSPNNLQHTIKLAQDTGNFCYTTQHGGWNALGHARGRSMALLLVSDPPLNNYGFAIKDVTFEFDMDPKDGQG